MRSTKSVKRVQERSSFKLVASFIPISLFMYSVRNLVRFSMENLPTKNDLNLPWNFGSRKVEAELPPSWAR
jgi:hypothetical protein